MAVAHSMLAIGYPMLNTGKGYRELGGGYLDQIDKTQQQRYLVKRLQSLGLKVILEPIPTAAWAAFSQAPRASKAQPGKATQFKCARPADF